MKLLFLDRGVTVVRIFAALFLCGAVAAMSRFPFDDAYIHMRIARHLAFDGQPYYNLGERVMGGSSPLWLLLVAGLFRVTNQPLPALVVGLECVLVVTLRLTVESWLAEFTRGKSWLTALLSLALVAGLVLPSAGHLMEPSLALLLSVAGLLALSRDRRVLAGLVLGLAAATRFEMGILAGIAWLATPGLRPRARFLAGFLPVLAAEAGLLWAWYRTLVPNTVRAKSVAYPITFEQFLQAVPGLPVMQILTVLACIAGAGLCAALAWRECRAPSRAAGAPAGAGLRSLLSLVIVGAFGAVLFLAYVVRTTMMFHWYWPLVFFPSALAAAATGLRLWTMRQQAGDGPTPWRASQRLALAAVALVGFAVGPSALRSANATTYALLDEPARSGTLEANLRARTYLALGDDLYRRCPEASLMISEIGAIGWAFRGRVVDGLGLVSPEVLRYHPLRVPEQRISATDGAVPAQAVIDLKPGLVVGMETFVTDFLAQRGKVPALAAYRLIDERPVLVIDGVARPLWNSKSIVTYAAADACPAR